MIDPGGAGTTTRPRRRIMFVSAVTALLVATGVVLRLLWIDRLPGIHGDEGWYGLIAQRWFSGDFAFPQTPTGNYPGPLHIAGVALGQAFLPGQFLALRLPTLFVSLAAMGLAWWIGRKHFDIATARIALVLMALLPANIAYARFGWDPSYSGLITLGAMAMALERRWAATAIVYGLAIWTHPTNVFIAPLLLTISFTIGRTAKDQRFDWRTAALFVALAALTAVLLGVTEHSSDYANAGTIFAQLASPAQWLSFIILFCRLIAGEPWFVHIAGSSYGAALPVVSVIGVSLLFGITWSAVRSLRDGLAFECAILIGWLIMLATYAAVAGSAPLNAGTERYGFVLIAPTALALAVAMRRWIGLSAGRVPEGAILASVGFTLIAATVMLYILPLNYRADSGNPSFRTGMIEPKEAAAQWLIAEAKRGPVRVIAEDWWLEWPMAYHLSGEPISVLNARSELREAASQSPERTFHLTHVDSELDRSLARSRRPVFVVQSRNGVAILRIWERAGQPRAL